MASDRPRTRNCYVAFANPNAGPASITLQLLNSEGVSVVPSIGQSLAGNQHTAVFVSQLFSGVALRGVRCRSWALYIVNAWKRPQFHLRGGIDIDEVCILFGFRSRLFVGRFWGTGTGLGRLFRQLLCGRGLSRPLGTQPIDRVRFSVSPCLSFGEIIVDLTVGAKNSIGLRAFLFFERNSRGGDLRNLMVNQVCGYCEKCGFAG